MKLKINAIYELILEVSKKTEELIEINDPEEKKKYQIILVRFLIMFFDDEVLEKNFLNLFNFYKNHGFEKQEIKFLLTSIFKNHKKWVDKYFPNEDYYDRLKKVYEILDKECKCEKNEDDFFFFEGEEVDDIINDMHYEDHEKISAKEFFESHPLDLDDLDKIEIIRDKLEKLIISFDIDEFKEIIFKLIGILDMYFVTKEMSGVSLIFEKLIEVLQLEGLNEEILISVVEDIIDWLEHVFINQDAVDIHYLDAAMFANISQMEMLAKNQS